jgi:hypothetical protein
MIHMSVLGAYWEQAYFEKEGYFGCMPIFGENTYLWNDLIFERKTKFWSACNRWQEIAACRKRRKSSMKEEKQRGAQAINPNHNRVRVFDKDCNDYKFVK